MNPNWQTKKLVDVCKVGAGNSAPQKKELFVNGKYPFFRTSDVGTVHIGSIKESNDYLNEAGIKKMRLLKKGTILFPKSGASTFLNHRVIMKVDGYASSHLATIKTKESVLDDNYLFYYLQEVRAQDLIQDHKYPSLNLPVIGGIKISFPNSLKEQEQIVKNLDEVFEKVTKAKEAVGKNLQNAKELFESYLHSVFANPGKDWEEKKFDEIVESNVIGLVKNTKEQSASKKYKYVKMNNITRDNSFDFSKYTRVDASQAEVEKYGLMAGDFLFNTRNSYELVGKTCIFNHDEEKGILFNNNIMRVRFIKSVNSYFINYAFSSRFIIKKLSHLKSGTTNVSAIYYKDLKNLVLPIPSLSEQKSIVKKLEELSFEKKKLEKIYELKLADLEELKKSVLSKAFHAEL